jgi:hypothetical protein
MRQVFISPTLSGEIKPILPDYLVIGNEESLGPGD